MALLLVGCGPSDPAGPEAQPQKMSGKAAPAASAAEPVPAGGWQISSTGEGAALVLGNPARPTIRLFCPAREKRLLVNVPAFRPIGSEERLSFGGGGEVVALVADTRGDPLRGGVTGSGSVPANLPQLLSAAISANYGSQDSGPHPPPSAEAVNAFAAACADQARAPDRQETPAVDEQPGQERVSACLVQGDKRLAANRLKAIGTEPFWAASTEGRCVTYSHPEDQKGTRVWASFSGSRDNGRWTGFLGNRSFVMQTRAQPGCSDGMSDKRYPIAVELTIGGERRSGCAEPL
jgi:uncharacterized membrane protein